MPSPPTSHKTSLTFPGLRSADPSGLWEDDFYSCQLAQTRDKAMLENEYHIYELEFLLCHVFPLPKYPLSRIRPEPKIEEYILSAHHNRYFIWCPLLKTEHRLQYILTPWSLKGLLNALNNPNEELVTRPIEIWDSAPPTPEDITPWPLTSLPHGWTDSRLSVLCYHAHSDFRNYDIHRRHPMLFYPSAGGYEDASFFESEGNFYIYKTWSEDLFELPDLQDPANLAKLGGAPDYAGLRLIEVGVAEMFGGRRSLEGTRVPEGWEQLPWDSTSRVVGLPDRCYDADVAAVLSNSDGTRHVIEVGEEYYLWFEPEEVVSKIEAEGGLEEILRTMRAGMLLDLRDP